MSETIDLDYLEGRAEAYIERNPDGGSGLWLADDVQRLIAEVRRLRALPVIATCGDCSRFTGDSQRERGGGTCDHPERSDFVGAVNADDSPEAWCPLRRSP